MSESLSNDFLLEKDKSYDIFQYGKVTIPLEVKRGNWDIAAISVVDDNDCKPDGSFVARLKDMLNVERYFSPVFFVIIYRSNLYLWRNYIKVKSGRTGNSLFSSSWYPEAIDFLQGGVDSTKIVSKEELIKLFSEYNPRTYCKFTYKDLQSFFMVGCPNADKNSLQTFIDSLKDKNIDEVVGGSTSYFWLNDKYEDLLFKNILKTDSCCPEYYRYVNSASLLKLLDNKTIAMSSIISMNDMSETNYANCYIKKRIDVGCIAKQIALSSDNDETVNTYICSLSEEDDDLAMWYMYGEQCKGAELIFEGFDENALVEDVFCLSKVSYADKDGNDKWLDYLVYLLRTKVDGRHFCLKRWSIWQHFFKPYYYHNEKEVRLLYLPDTLMGDISSQQQWCDSPNKIHFPFVLFMLNAINTQEKSKALSHFPLKLTSIKLGPLYPENHANALAWTVEIRHRWSEYIKFITSKIKDYRG